MNRLITILALLLFGSVFSYGNNPGSDDDSIIKVKTSQDFILIEALRDSDLMTKRPITILDESGHKIFKTKARKYEQITEINMSNVKEGIYLIQIEFEDKTVDIEFEKTAE